jgi:type II secretory pathway pseudopilin PulG
MKSSHLKPIQQGFALIAAIVLIVVLAAMAGFVAAMVGGQSAGQQLERMSGVADMAVQTGVEWGAYQVLRQPVAACAPSSNLPTLPGSLGVMTVTVTCTSSPTTEPLTPGPGMVTVYQITARAFSGGNPTSPDFVERTKTAVFSR